jgi:hypothetical protein
MGTIRSTLVSAAVAAAVFATPSSSIDATAAEPQVAGSIAVAYSIAFWGIPFGETNYQGRFSETGYAASSHFETSGIVSLFWQAVIDASANGKISPRSLDPRQYDSFYRRGGDKKERVQVTFKDGAVKTFADPPYDTSKFPVTDSEKREAVDPMSAVTLILSGIRADHANPCGTAAPVFDGRRRYDIEFTYLKDELVTLPAGLFHGTAHLCQLHYRQTAGFKPKILKEGAAFPPIYGDFGDFPAPNSPSGHYVVALKLWSRLKWGTVSAALTKFTISADAPKG